MVKLAILWHMHQPYYEDVATGAHILPWVRLHGIKDYLGMVSLLEEFPDVRVTFNLVPSLLLQVQAFADDRARDRHLAAGLAAPGNLGPDETTWFIANAFHAPVDRMIAPYPRYHELHARRHTPAGFDAADVRDLQVWHKLAWMDPDRLRLDPRLVSLVEKGRGYTEDDKQTLRAVELELLRQVIPAYRAASDRGQAELSTSPFFHPILPLLCDTDVHLRAHPDAPRPRRRFAHPEDAREQVDRAVAFHTRLFGRRPAGMWPSEGSVSDETLRLVADAGLSWVATDEDILARTLGVGLSRDGFGHAERPDILYRPYRLGTAELRLAGLFRDHALSDRIGFAYQTWEAGAAADDFVERVREAGRRYSAAGQAGEATVSVILDGENAWEHYPGGGRPFLRALYQRLQAASDIQTVTMSEAAATADTRLPTIFPGSWIQSDFSIWIGHADDRHAWSQLADAREAFEQRAPSVDADARERARTELMVAEGSDWFWWYGDDHSSDHDRDFDDLFRRHLRNAYDALGLPSPDSLYVTNITTDAAGSSRLPAIRLDRVVLDGRDTDGVEWLGAAVAPLGPRGGSMHASRVAGSVDEVRVGVTAGAICLRLLGHRLAASVAAGELRLALAISAPTPMVLEVLDGWLAVDRTVEVQAPWSALGVRTGTDFAFAILLRDASGGVVEQVPDGSEWRLDIPRRDVADWSV